MPTKIQRGDHQHYVRMGDADDPDAIRTRIVHVSDTHLHHGDMLNEKSIPDGDILVHSGDFNSFHRNAPIMPQQDLQLFVERLNTFFDSLPHRHKIFVPGNHDVNIEDKSWPIMQSLLPTCVYLQDVSVTIEGIKFYGAGWNLVRECSSARSFAVEPEDMPKHWENIPTDTEILVTHSPPYAILDCSHCRRQGGVTYCTPKKSCGHGHTGCSKLRDVVLNRVRPKMHLFGHNHGGNQVITHKGTVFSNAAVCLDASSVPAVIDYYHTPEVVCRTSLPVL